VGAGTGKATAPAAARGLRVLALEPDAGMAAVARHNCAGLDVEIVEDDFEHWPIRERFGGLLSVQSWHWVDHDVRFTADYPMHPDSDPDRLAGDWRSEIAESAGFCDPEVALFVHTVEYSSSEYADLLQTHSGHILLEDGRRRELLEAIRQAVGTHGGWFSLPFKVWVCSATRLRR
jgi:hypothetical protein